ncbi:hypothetical protein B7494_g4747 [Chlorociboria aeruginascens]|nr:hypothetical protein B7494_g4747 [Chlorociboria aeruginascens]
MLQQMMGYAPRGRQHACRPSRVNNAHHNPLTPLWANEATIEAVYIRELEQYLKEVRRANEVRGLDFQVGDLFIHIGMPKQVRKKDPEFPINGGRPLSSPQPSLMTHSIVHELYGNAAPQILKSRFQIIIIWKSLRVPVRDWPLALCDATSVDQADLVDADVIYPNYLAENRMVHFNEDQKWYWLPDQAANEILPQSRPKFSDEREH